MADSRGDVVIEYRDVHKTFDVPVLAGVSLRVTRGEILAILGPSGTGKSVLLKTTIGLIEPDRGDVFIEGRSMVHASRAEKQELRRKAGYVFQNAALFDSMTVYENVAYGLSDDSQKEIGRQEVLRRVTGSLEAVNLSPAEVLNKMPADLSGGMRKRVGLARAIVGEPRILLYDEPVTGLDPVNAAAVDQLIESIADRLDVTSLVVTHDIPGALSIADRVALLEGGKLRFIGTPDEFLASREPIVQAFADREAAAAAARGEGIWAGPRAARHGKGPTGGSSGATR
jgi:phospholipid/cholesterol/gamma-HCH transport system ATP-binding protein